MIKIKAKRYYSKDRLEFELFKSLEFETDFDIGILNRLEEYMSNSYCFYKVVYKNEKTILSEHQEKIVILVDNGDLEVGDFVIGNYMRGYDNNNNDDSFQYQKIAVDFDEDFFDELDKDIGKEDIWFRINEDDEITKDNLKIQFQLRINEEIINKKRNDDEFEAKKIEMEEINNKWKNEGIFEKGSFKIKGKEITGDNFKIILNRNVKEVFNYDEINIHYFYDYERKMIDKLIEKSEYFTLYDNIGEIYHIKFGKKIDINGVIIPRGKLNFVLNRINKDTTKEQLELYKKLTGMKLETMEKKSIRVNNLETNISFDIIDVDTFKVNFMGEEINMKWDKIKDYFFESGSSRSFYFRGEPKEVLRLCKEFGINKEKCFETLKTIKIASEL